tara:strand:- start:384 stop:761 length:378 start_codon:yes stop_codon:yes gene_type:complete
MVNNLVRIEVPNRMQCFNLRMIVDNRTVNTSVDYAVSGTGVNPMAIWVKLKPNESTLDREVRAEGKLASLLLQYGCSLKEVSDTLGKDSIIGAVANYLNKNIADILAGNQPDKIPNLNTDPYRIK